MFLLEQAGSLSLCDGLFKLALGILFLLEDTLNDLSVVYDSFEGANGGARGEREYIFDVSRELRFGVVVLNHVCDSVNIKYFIVTAGLDEWVLISAQGAPSGDDSSVVHCVDQSRRWRGGESWSISQRLLMCSEV
jgi:hypothetical protein